MEKHSTYVSLRIDDDIATKIEQIAIKEHSTKSDIIRKFIEKGLKNDGYTENNEKLTSCLSEILQPQIERLAAISAKATHISAAAFFMELFVARLTARSEQRELIDTVAGKARKLGIEYLKLKDCDIDDFLRTCYKKLNDEEI